MDEKYRQQVRLLLRALPHVATEACFALKGGTAINLFIRDLPRLSVDIDLAYLPVSPRTQSLEAIDAALKRIAERIRNGLNAGVKELPSGTEAAVVKLLIRAHNVQIKIEVTPALRGCVFDPELRTVSATVEDSFGFAEINVVSFADLYAGKIVAALDRQHPRDLFDVMGLLAIEGIDANLRSAFIVYLLSHNRPMAEVLDPTLKDISDEFERGFAGMTDNPVQLDDLITARETLITTVVGDMPDEHRSFLLSFEQGEPDWPLLGLADVDRLPAVLWRQRNLNKISPEKRETLVIQLETALSREVRVTPPQDHRG